MQTYNFSTIEQKWQNKWEKQNKNETVPLNLPTYYILNMFPYPSGSGLHVGHYIGYIASDIVARYWKHKGYHVMNPMGFDAFGLPAEQYAIQTGQHPAITTAQNMQKYRQQLQQIALAFDWERTIHTSDPAYYKWTQWIFLQLFHAWYNTVTQKAAPIETLIQAFARGGNRTIQAACDRDTPIFSAQEWHSFTESKKQALLLHYRLAYLKDNMVNWCEALGTVLANEEVKDGFSERGGYPVIRKTMKQWSLRITAYAERLLSGLDNLDWPLSTKEMQRHWIGRSEGMEIVFRLQGQSDKVVTVFTTRPETIFGVCFIALAPEHPLAQDIAQQMGNGTLMSYIEQAKNRSERSRLAVSTDLNAVFTDSYVLHPFTGKSLPIWVADYVLPHYGTGAVMGVPAHDKRDYLFAKSAGLYFPSVIVSKETIPYESTTGKMQNSDFLDGLTVTEACAAIIPKLIHNQIGKSIVHYKLQDPVFSRQRYWGEPIPIYYKEDGLPYALSETALPLLLPAVKRYQPNPSGAPPLSNAENWCTAEGYPLELTTMPGWAGSSWYFLRYMDPHNTHSLIDKAQEAYWKKVDCYIGGSEHATGHLLYARFWTKLLHDLGHIHMDEPFPKLFHQGIILHCAALVYRIKDSHTFVSFNLIATYEVVEMYVPTAFVQNDLLDLEAFRNWHPEWTDVTFILENDQYVCGRSMEKMSKSKHNVINPDTIIAQYGADALRLYMMFLGPLDQCRIWDITGIEGMNRFLHKVWRLVHHSKVTWPVTTIPQEMNHLLHKTIKKVKESIEKNAFNTAISSLMICVNQLATFASVSQSVIENVILLLEPFAPHIAAELWENIGKEANITTTAFPSWDAAYVAEKNYHYPVAINGKVRTKLLFAHHTAADVIESTVLANAVIQKWLKGKSLEKVIIVSGRMINIVVK